MKAEKSVITGSRVRESSLETGIKDGECNSKLCKPEKIRGESEEAIWSGNVTLGWKASSVNAGMRDRCTRAFTSKETPGQSTA